MTSQTAQFAPCPQCQASDANRLNFTWWGGALGPKMLNHVKCSNCGTKYNGKTGGSNTGGIVVYTIVTGILAFILLFFAVSVLPGLSH